MRQLHNGGIHIGRPGGTNTNVEGRCVVWKLPASNAIWEAGTKQFECPPVLRDADVCCATTSPTKDQKLEPDVAVGKATPSTSSSRWNVQKDMWNPEHSSPDKTNQLGFVCTNGSMGL